MKIPSLDIRKDIEILLKGIQYQLYILSIRGAYRDFTVGEGEESGYVNYAIFVLKIKGPKGVLRGSDTVLKETVY